MGYEKIQYPLLIGDRWSPGLHPVFTHSTTDRTRAPLTQNATHFLFLRVDQLFVIPVFQFARSLSGGHGGVKDEELSTALCCLQMIRGTREGNDKQCSQVKVGTMFLADMLFVASL